MKCHTLCAALYACRSTQTMRSFPFWPLFGQGPRHLPRTLHASFNLTEQEAQVPEFEVIVEGFPHACFMMGRRLTAQGSGSTNDSTSQDDSSQQAAQDGKCGGWHVGC